MKKKINKDYTKHWLYPYIGTYAMNFIGMSFGRLYQLLTTLSDNIDDNSNIHFTCLSPVPVGKDIFSLVGYISYCPGYPDFDTVQFVSTYPLKRSTLSKYGSLIIDNMGFYSFIPRKKWTIKYH